MILILIFGLYNLLMDILLEGESSLWRKTDRENFERATKEECRDRMLFLACL